MFKVIHNSFKINTPNENFINITYKIEELVKESKITNGRVLVFSPHTTGGITVNENADPDVVTDMLIGLDKAFPDRNEFRHAEGNTTAHSKASAMGSGQSFIIKNSEIILGIWQNIYFCEFDGPRTRTVFVSIEGI